jgi:CHAT domain-containing protein
LWPVSDEAAQRIMQSFYSGLVRDGLSKAEALRQAQMSLLGDANLQHPYYWTPFILVGNWR